MHIPLYGDGTESPKTTSDPKSDTIEPRVRLYFTLHSAMTQKVQIIYATPSSDEPSEMIHARYAVLAAMPLPPDAPADTLKPIVIPAPFTFNEFINSITSVSARISYALETGLSLPLAATKFVGLPMRSIYINSHAR